MQLELIGLKGFKFSTLVLLSLLLISTSFVAWVPFINSAYASSTATLTEWTVPTANSLPTGLALDPSGNCCWFVESSGNKVVHFDTSTNTFQEWAIPTTSSSPTSLATTTISGSVAVFGTEFSSNKVFLFFPNTGVFKEYTLPTADSGPEYISVEPSGADVRAWFSEIGTTGTRNAIGEIRYIVSSATAELYEWALPAGAGGGANGVYAGSGIIWFAGFTAIVKWDRAASQFTTWSIPSHPSTYAAFLAVDSLGQVWYTSRSPGGSSTNNFVGVLRGDNTFREWQIPTTGADPRVISVNPVNLHPWIAEQMAPSNEGRIAELDPSSGGVVTGSAPITSPVSSTLGALGVATSGPVSPSTIVVGPVLSTNTGSVAGQFTEWTLATGSRPHDVVVDASGNTWILESGSNKVAKLTPTTPDFGLVVAPPNVPVTQGSLASATATVSSASGFSSPVTLSATGVPAGLTIGFGANPVTPPPGASATSEVSVAAASSTVPGTYVIAITGTSSSTTHSTTLTVVVTATVVPDFSIASSATSISITQGSSGAATITLGSLNAFNSAVTLSGSWVGTAPSDASFTLPSPVTPSSGGTATSTLTITAGLGASAGVFTFRVTGTSGAIIHSTDIGIEISAAPGDFAISASPNSLSVSPGSTATSTVTIQSIGAFSSAVSLATSGAPSGITIVFGTNPITPPAGGTASSMLTLTNSESGGTYTITITGTSGSLTHGTTLTVQVSPRCLIATATFGSELSPEVQFLRNFRDDEIQRTYAGSNFMTAFNAWYYSFSPYVATYLTNHWVERTVMKGLLYPLMGILLLSSELFSTTRSYPEVAALLTGLLASSLIGAFYIGLPLSLLRTKVRRLGSWRIQNMLVRLLSVTLLAGVGGLIVGELLTVDGLVILATSSIALSALFLSAILFSATLAKSIRNLTGPRTLRPSP